MFEPDLAENQISSLEANTWWRQKTPVGAVLNKLMVLFVLLPIALVFKNLYALSFGVFALMVPYGLLVRHLAVRAVRYYLQNHPEERENFERAGIISC